ncbi:MAG: hypothetical protein AAFR04_15660, partial [Pseudomonadota bacterium]
IGIVDPDSGRMGEVGSEPLHIHVRIVETEIIRAPDGSERERRERRMVEPNTDADLPLSWTGRKIAKADAMRRFVFSSKFQIVHVNGLTYDFLHAIARELDESESLMLLGGGASGKEPLVFRRGGVTYRGFLEGRVDGPRYILLLHLSNLELKRPEPLDERAAASEGATAGDAAAPSPKVPARKTPRKAPSVKDVIAKTEATTASDAAPASAASGAREAIKPTAKAARRKKQQAKGERVAEASAKAVRGTPSKTADTADVERKAAGKRKSKTPARAKPAAKSKPTAAAASQAEIKTPKRRTTPTKAKAKTTKSAER